MHPLDTRNPPDPKNFTQACLEDARNLVADSADLAAPGGTCSSACEDGLCVETCSQTIAHAVRIGAARIGAGLGAVPFDGELAALIDHTLLKPDATPAQIEQLCSEAKRYGFASVVINPTYVELAARLLRGTKVRVGTVIGFPLGATSSAVKAFEAQDAIGRGAQEIDMVMNIGALKARNYSLVIEDVRSVVGTCRNRGVLTKVIIETGLLTDEEKVAACLLAKEAGADFVKTSTGFGPGGATLEDVALMRRVVGPSIGVKASGGIRTLEQAREMIAAGATRLGTNASVQIESERQDDIAVRDGLAQLLGTKVR